MDNSAVGQFFGPAGPGGRHTGWDSVILALPEGEVGNKVGSSRARQPFVLELWRFYETWHTPASPSSSQPLSPHGPETHFSSVAESPLENAGLAPAIVDVADLGESNNVQLAASRNGDSIATGSEVARVDAIQNSPRKPAPVLEREETRATLRGSLAVSGQTVAVKLGGFRKVGLNQVFVEVSERLVNGAPTWWSQDGRLFFYYSPEYGHWKANAVRTAGGDGILAVAAGGRRAGHGFAHTGPATGSEGAAALACSEGWFELAGGEWEPIRPAIVPAQADLLHFEADTVQIEELSAYNEESSRVSRTSGPSSFIGVQTSSVDGVISSQSRRHPADWLLLLSLPQVLFEEEAVGADHHHADGGDERWGLRLPRSGAIEEGTAMPIVDQPSVASGATGSRQAAAPSVIADALGDPVAVLLERASSPDRSRL